MNILLGLTGSVATVLYVKLIEKLSKFGKVKVILTEKAEHFISMPDLCDVLEKTGSEFFTEEDEWKWKVYNTIDDKGWRYTRKWKKNDAILHINLRDDASALVIAPCSANTLAKLSNGICDNLLTSVARAWDANRPVIVAPAMNTHMWTNVITEKHVNNIKETFKYTVIPPQNKMLACNTEGLGALADIDDIISSLTELLRWEFPFVNKVACSGIPTGSHPGSFAAIRKNSVHTGVDLYVDEETQVVPVENGTVVGIEKFTGPQDNSPWWLDTQCVLVEGASGVICYGEVKPYVTVGDTVIKGKTVLGHVLRVIPETSPQHPEIEGWKPSMLHMELYPHKIYKASNGYDNDKHILRDPTEYLINASNAPRKLYK